MKVLISDVYDACDILLSPASLRNDKSLNVDLLTKLKEKLLKIYIPISVTDSVWGSISLSKMSKRLYADATETTEFSNDEYKMIKDTYLELSSARKEERQKTISRYKNEHSSYIKLERKSAFWGFMQKWFCT